MMIRLLHNPAAFDMGLPESAHLAVPSELARIRTQAVGDVCLADNGGMKNVPSTEDLLALAAKPYGRFGRLNPPKRPAPPSSALGQPAPAEAIQTSQQTASPLPAPPYALETHEILPLLARRIFATHPRKLNLFLYLYEIGEKRIGVYEGKMDTSKPCLLVQRASLESTLCDVFVVNGKKKPRYLDQFHLVNTPKSKLNGSFLADILIREARR